MNISDNTELASSTLPNQIEFTDSSPFTYLQTRMKLQEKLLNGYTHLKTPASAWRNTHILTPSETLSLCHYIAWKRSNGTVKTYKYHADNLKIGSKTDILSLYNVHKLATDLTHLTLQKFDMCPNSCLAYTGDFESLTSCPYRSKKTVCGQSRYTARGKPRAQMLYLGFIDYLKGMFANLDTANALRYRDKLLQQTLALLATASGANSTRKFSDFADSDTHIHHFQKMGLFTDPRDVAFALSTDSAQLTMKKQSDTWLLILIILNLPSEMRYKTHNIIVPLTIPGPHKPGNLESFLYLLYQDFAKASEDIWLWDAVDQEYFLSRSVTACVLKTC